MALIPERGPRGLALNATVALDKAYPVLRCSVGTEAGRGDDDLGSVVAGAQPVVRSRMVLAHPWLVGPKPFPTSRPWRIAPVT